MSERSRAAVEGLIGELTTQPHREGSSRELASELRSAIGRLVVADPETIGLTRGTSHAISLLAQGLDWNAGDNVVGAEGEFPANVYPWMALRERGVELRLARPDGGRLNPDSVLSLVDARTRVVALSHVSFWNGFRLDLEAIGGELDRRGVLFAVDAIQSVGALRLNLARLPVDYLSAGAYKWQLGPQGIGFCYCRPELLHRLRPILVGTGTMADPDELFTYRFELEPTARRFEESSVSSLDMTAYLAAVELLLEIGPDRIEERVLRLSARLAEGLAGHGYEIVEPWPRRPDESSGIVSFRRPGSAPHAALRDLNAARVVARIHSDFVRLAPHFYNTEEEVDRVLEVLAPNGVTF